MSSFPSDTTLQARLTKGPLAIRDTLTLACSLLEALEKVHAQGIVYRHIKPAHIVVNEAGLIHQATLVDSGLGRAFSRNADTPEMLLEVAMYSSPEQAGTLSHRIDVRSDLYTVGLVLFECLAGRPPFQGNSIGEILRQHVSAPPPRLRVLGLAVPRALDEALQRLLQKDPRDRYQNASAARTDLLRIAADLDRGNPDPQVAVGTCDYRHTLTHPAFVGRTEELATIEAEFSQARHGHGRLVFVEGKSGDGKTSVLDEFALTVARQDALIIRGQGTAFTAQYPFQILNEVVSSLLRAIRSEAALGKALQSRLTPPSVQAALCRALPQLAEVLQQPTSDALGPEIHAEARTLHALSCFLDALGSPHKPAVVLLDDCQWADDLTMKLLRYWQRRHSEETSVLCHVLLVVAFRPEEVPVDQPLRTIRPDARLNLAPLGDKEIRDLALSMAGPLPDTALALVTRLSEGSPFMTIAILRGLVETGLLVPDSDVPACPPAHSVWRFQARGAFEIQSSRTSAALLSRRLDLLPQETLRLLSIGAILGRTFDLVLAALLAGQPKEKAVHALEPAKERHLLWLDRKSEQGCFVHDKVREAVLARIPDEERRQIHLQATLCLEARDPSRIFDIAYHFDEAGMAQRALPYALAAAAQARARYALELAEHYYRIALRGTAADDVAMQLRVAEDLGDVLMLRGCYDAAAEQYESAHALAENTQNQARIGGKCGELAFRRGDMRTASKALEQALTLLGRRVPRMQAGFIVSLAWETLIQALHTCFPRLFLARRTLDPDDTELLAMRLYSRLGYVYWFQHGKLPCLWAHLRELNLTECYPPTPQLAQAYSEHAPAMSMIPWISRGITYVERSLAYRQVEGDLWGQAQSLHFYGVLLYAASRYAECIEKCRAAVRLFDQTGDAWEADAARWHIAYCFYRFGNLSGALELSKQLHRRGQEIGNTQLQGLALEIWSLASNGRVPRELIETELRRPRDDGQTIASVFLAEGRRLLGEGSPAEAAVVFSQALKAVGRTGIRNEYVVPLYVWQATALRQAAEATSSNPKRRTAHLRRAGAAVRVALRLARRFQNSLPHALREAGLLAAVRGYPARALSLLTQSLQVAERQGAQYERAQTLLDRGLLGQELAWPDTTRDLAHAQQLLQDLGIDTTPRRRKSDATPPAGSRSFSLSLVDRFDGVLNAGRRIASLLSPDQIYTAVWDAAVALLRGDDGAVLTFTRQATGVEIRVVAGHDHAELSHVMGRRILATDRPAIISEDRPGSAGESTPAIGVRTAIYAPLTARGQVIGGFYMMHHHLDALFEDDELQLAEFISVLAGAALENAEGFATLQRAHEELSLRAADAALNAAISGAVLRPGTLPIILQDCAEIITRHFDVALVTIWTHDKAADRLHLQAHAGPAIRHLATGSAHPIAATALRAVISSGEPYFTNAADQDPLIQDCTWVEQEAIASFSAYPLAVENRVVGVMALFARQPWNSSMHRKLSLVVQPLSQCIIRKWTEEEIRTLNAELEGRVVSRTNELQAAKKTLEDELLQRNRASRRLAIQYAVTRALSDSHSLGEAVPKILQAICENLGWKFAAFWQVDRHADVVRLVDSWYLPCDEVVEFDRLSRTTVFSPGIGLPGRIWSSRQPRWIHDVMKDVNYPRVPAAAQAGLHSAFGAPILLQNEVLGVIEFYSQAIQEPDEDLLRMMAAIGSQIGQFIERKRAEEALRESEERYRTVAETAAEGIITMNEAGTIVFVNRAVEQIFGYTWSEMVGQPLTIMMPERLRGTHVTGLARYLHTGKRKLNWEQVHLPGRHKSGKEIPLELAFWEFTQQGQRFFSSLVRDITERVQATVLRSRLLEQIISAQEEERRRIARELHDETGQSLMSLIVGLQRLEPESDPALVQANLQKLRHIAEGTLDEVKRLAMGLRPSILDDLGLIAALERYAAEYFQAHRITVDLHASRDLQHSRLPDPIEITLYRIIQEALTNIAKHAHASLVSIVVERQPGGVQAIIEDNGCGFDTEAGLQLSGTTGHLGLHGMRERARLVNGSLEIESTPGCGTTLYVRIPLETATHD